VLIYRLTGPLDWSDEELETKLNASAFRPCGSQDLQRVGWVSAMPDGELMAHQANGNTLLCLRRQQKIVPGPAVAEALEEKIGAIEREQARKVYRKERKQLKEEILVTLLPRALTRSSRLYAYIDRRNGWVLVNSGSHSRAEELLTQLRNDMGSLPVEPVATNSNPALVMTDWLQHGNLPANFVIGQQCELRDSKESSNIVRVRGQELCSDEILQHVVLGKQVTRLELQWHEAIDFVLGEDLIVRRLRFADALREQVETQEDERAQFDQEFAVMSIELGKFLHALLAALGGAVEK
jgi:recombination associated protein RdgC